MMTSGDFPRADYFTGLVGLTGTLEEFNKRYYPYASLSGSLPGLLQWQGHFQYALGSREGVSFPLAFYGGRHVYLPLPPRPFTRQTLEMAFGYLREVNGPDDIGVSRIEGLTDAEKHLVESWGLPARETLVEYLYDRAKTAALPGDPYRAKRAEVNHLLKHHAVSFRRYQPEDAEACRDVFERWSIERAGHLKGEMGSRMLEHSVSAHGLVLTDGMTWGLQGWVAEVEGKVAAYTFGTLLSPDTYGVVMEVADLTIKGLSAYIFSRLCGSLDRVALINAGDAEGLPGLEEAKEHWHPARKLQLYAVDRRMAP